MRSELWFVAAVLVLALWSPCCLAAEEFDEFDMGDTDEGVRANTVPSMVVHSTAEYFGLQPNKVTNVELFCKGAVPFIKVGQDVVTAVSTEAAMVSNPVVKLLSGICAAGTGGLKALLKEAPGSIKATLDAGMDVGEVEVEQGVLMVEGTNVELSADTANTVLSSEAAIGVEEQTRTLHSTAAGEFAKYNNNGVIRLKTAGSVIKAIGAAIKLFAAATKIHVVHALAAKVGLMIGAKGVAVCLGAAAVGPWAVVAGGAVAAGAGVYLWMRGTPHEMEEQLAYLEADLAVVLQSASVWSHHSHHAHHSHHNPNSNALVPHHGY